MRKREWRHSWESGLLAGRGSEQKNWPRMNANEHEWKKGWKSFISVHQRLSAFRIALSDRCSVDRQAGVLYTDRPGYSEGLCVRERSNVVERDGGGCAGGNGGVPGKAVALLVGEVKRRIGRE